MSGKTFQFDLFREEKLERQVAEDQDFKKSTMKCIRGLFRRNNELEFVVLEMHKKIEKMQQEVFRNV